MALEQIAQGEELSPKLLSVLSSFQGRLIDDALVTEMTGVLNDELARWREDRRIRLVWEGFGICVHVDPEEDPARQAGAGQNAEASDGWESRTHDAHASV